MENKNGEARVDLLAEFLKNFGERAYCVAFRLCRNKEEAKDLVQETCCRALQKWDLYDPTKKLDSWFLCILWNLFIDQWRKGAKGRKHLESMVTTDGDRISYLEIVASRDQPMLEMLVREETDGLVREAIEALKPWQKEALALREIEGFRYEDIAERLDIPIGTVRSRISRARQCLRKTLTERDPEITCGRASGG